MDLEQGMVRIEHKHGPNYRIEYVSGLATAGPLDDQLVRLTFFRDALPPFVELLKVVSSTPTVAKVADTASGVSGKVDVQLYREDVVTLLVSPGSLQRFAASLMEVAQQLNPPAGS